MPEGGGASLRRARRREFVLLFVLLPLGPVLLRPWMGVLLIPLLLTAGVLALRVLLRDSAFPRRHLGRGWGAPLLDRRTLAAVAAGAALLALALALLAPERLFRLPREEPVLWLLVSALYPLASVLPQELLFRVFFFHRYRVLWPSLGVRIAVSAVVFAWAHLFFGNAVAPLLSLAGGLWFAADYARHGSLLRLACLHALWGELLFLLGYGEWFLGRYPG